MLNGAAMGKSGGLGRNGLSRQRYKTRHRILVTPLEALGVQIGQPANRVLDLFEGLTEVGQLVLDLDRQFEQRLRAAGHAVVDDVHREIMQLEDVVADFGRIVIFAIVQLAAHFVEFVDRMDERERIESVL